jgi:hypothetical protein
VNVILNAFRYFQKLLVVKSESDMGDIVAILPMSPCQTGLRRLLAEKISVALKCVFFCSNTVV